MMCVYSYAKQPEGVNDTILIGLGGDTMLGRLVNEKLRVVEPTYVWGNLLEELHATDLNLINMEHAFTTRETPVPKVFNFKSDPKHVNVLQKARIDVVSLANNHILDFGVEGLRDTLATLDAAGIKHVGAGGTIKQAQEPVIIIRKGITIGILGWTDNEPTWKATETKPGTNYYAVHDIAGLKQEIRVLKQRVDLVIVTLHWGPNMRQRPTEEFRRIAHELLDAGADILHGHSAHIFQGIEITHDHKLILYDTGDFVDDYQVDPILRNDQSFFFKVRVDKDGLVSLELVPTIIKNMQIHKVERRQAQKQLMRMRQLSKEFATFLRPDGSWSRS